jgi:hypothetical protein
MPDFSSCTMAFFSTVDAIQTLLKILCWLYFRENVQKMSPLGTNSSSQKKMLPTAQKHVLQSPVVACKNETVQARGHLDVSIKVAAAATAATKWHNRSRGKKSKAAQQTKQVMLQSTTPANDEANALPNAANANFMY